MKNLLITSNNRSTELVKNFKNFTILDINNQNFLNNFFNFIGNNPQSALKNCIIDNLYELFTKNYSSQVISILYRNFHTKTVLFKEDDYDVIQSNSFFSIPIYKESINNKIKVFKIIKLVDRYLKSDKSLFDSKSICYFLEKNINENSFYIDKIDKNQNFLTINKSFKIDSSEWNFIFSENLEKNNDLILNILKETI